MQDLRADDVGVLQGPVLTSRCVFVMLITEKPEPSANQVYGAAIELFVDQMKA